MIKKIWYSDTFRLIFIFLGFWWQMPLAWRIWRELCLLGIISQENSIDVFRVIAGAMYGGCFLLGIVFNGEEE